jgi:hypothetical protein
MAVGNLELIDKTEITTSVSSVDITDVFSSKYDVYKIVTNGIEDTTNTPSLHIRFINSSGSVISASNYDYAYWNMRSEAGFAQSTGTNQSYIRGVFGFSSATHSQGSVTYIFNPYLATSYTFGLSQFSSYNTTLRSIKNIGVLKQTASMTGFQLFDIDSTNFSEGVIKTYGLASN